MRWGAVEANDDDSQPTMARDGNGAAGGDEDREVSALPWDRRLGLYAFVQPFVGGRRVIELWPHLEGDGEHLRAAGAAEVSSLSPNNPSLPMEDGAVDLVLCPNFLPADDAAAIRAWLVELARVLAPGGLCVVRAPGAQAIRDGGVTLPSGIFAETAIVEEVAFGGVSFRVAGTEDLAIVGDLSPLMAEADFEIWIGSVTAGGLPELTESALVPLPGFPEQLATTAALQATEQALDEARLAAASRDDRAGLTQVTVTSLRAAVERQLQQLADVEVTLGRITAERDEAVLRSDAAEARVHTAEAALRRREWEVDALRRDLARLGRTPGPDR